MTRGSVIILGGGVAGMSAAHELCERGFSVRVFEQRDIPGGKARSVVVPSTVPRQNVGTVNMGRLTAPTRRDLPGEHGFRFFPRFYTHIVDTMRRIPYRGSRSVAENLVDTSGTVFARFDRPPLTLPNSLPRSLVDISTSLRNLASFYGPDFAIAPADHAFFVERIWEILTTCPERRMTDFEKIGWWDLIGAQGRSEDYQKLYAIGLTRSLVAARARVASAKTIGNTFVQLLFNLSEPGVSTDRVLNGPTNDVWMDPWLRYLRSRGVEYNLNARVRSIDASGGSIRSVTVERDRRISEERADCYVAALPVEVMLTLVTDQLVRADPALGNLFRLRGCTAWMNGIQFYLSEDVPIGRGHQIYIDSPWALTSISQRQFWPDVDLSRFGAGDIRGIISVDISDWDAPGLNGKPARDCTRLEIRDEVWQQLKRSLNVAGTTLLEDEDVRHWYLDLDVDPLFKSNAEPLFVNLVDTWQFRPTATTRIPNLFLASDYVQTFTDLATMEAANEAARRAVNGIIEKSGESLPLCRIWNLHEPELLEPWRAHDRARYREGLPWDGTLIRLALSALVALREGTAALEAAVRDSVRAATHVDDLLAYIRTGESRSALLERLTSGPTEQTGGELLRAFAAMARATTTESEATSSAAIEALGSVARELGALGRAAAPSGGGVRFVEP